MLKELNSRFYAQWGYRFHHLTWHPSFRLDSEAKVAAAVSAMHVSDFVRAGLSRSKWGGVRATLESRAGDMMAYLSELVDDLLMCKFDTEDSKAPGFEAPLGGHCRDK